MIVNGYLFTIQICGFIITTAHIWTFIHLYQFDEYPYTNQYRFIHKIFIIIHKPQISSLTKAPRTSSAGTARPRVSSLTSWTAFWSWPGQPWVMGKPWGNHGETHEQPWKPWKTHENPWKTMENPWKTYGKPCKTHGKPMENPRKSLEIYGYIWKNHGNPLLSLMICSR